jgi:hypothetical protein
MTIITRCGLGRGRLQPGSDGWLLKRKHEAAAAALDETRRDETRRIAAATMTTG